MRHKVESRTLGKPPAHRKAMLANMVTSLIINDRIETTLTRAKEARRLAERMVTLSKKGTIPARRQAAKTIKTDTALRKLFSTFAERYKERPGGYTRIFRLGNRLGDNAPMAVLEFLSAEVKASAKDENPKGKKSTKSASKASAKKTSKTTTQTKKT